MPNSSEPQIVKPSLAPAVEPVATIPISVLIESVDCKIAEPGDAPSLSKMNKSGKTEKKRSLKTRDNRARPHLINILVYLVFASTTLMGLNIGYEGSLRFLGRKIEETKANISAAEDRNAVELMVRSKLDTLTHDHLPLRFFETHEDCLVRGAHAAYSRALPGDYTDFPKIRNQTLAWIADSCEKIYTPQAQQLTPKRQLAIVWQHWRQEVKDLLQLMKYKLGNARGWLRLKLGRTYLTQRFAPLNTTNHGTTDHDTTDHNAVDHGTKSTRVLEPISIYIRWQTSRCHLFYVPLVKHLLESSVVQQESPSIVERKLNILQETHTKFKRTSFWLTLVTMGMIFLEESLHGGRLRCPPSHGRLWQLSNAHTLSRPSLELPIHALSSLPIWRRSPWDPPAHSGVRTSAKTSLSTCACALPGTVVAHPAVARRSLVLGGPF
jgi:hypothetical protein